MDGGREPRINPEEIAGRQREKEDEKGIEVENE